MISRFSWARKVWEYYKYMSPILVSVWVTRGGTREARGDSRGDARYRYRRERQQ